MWLQWNPLGVIHSGFISFVIQGQSYLCKLLFSTYHQRQLVKKIFISIQKYQQPRPYKSGSIQFLQSHFYAFVGTPEENVQYDKNEKGKFVR
jgi:hypothetical protein